MYYKKNTITKKIVIKRNLPRYCQNKQPHTMDTSHIPIGLCMYTDLYRVRVFYEIHF